MGIGIDGISIEGALYNVYVQVEKPIPPTLLAIDNDVHFSGTRKIMPLCFLDAARALWNGK